MLPWWKRVIYSFVSVIIGGSVVGAIVSFRDVLLNPASHIDPEQILVSACIVLGFSLPGWLVAAPILILVKDYNGWRLWAWGITGICIGPSLIFGLAIYQHVEYPQSGALLSDTPAFMVLACAVSALATVVYLLLVRGMVHKLFREDPSASGGHA